MLPNTKPVERYIILSEVDPGKLQGRIEDQRKKGFQPYGPLLVHAGKLHQAMVVYGRTIPFFAVVDPNAPGQTLTDFSEEDGGAGT